MRTSLPNHRLKALPHPLPTTSPAINSSFRNILRSNIQIKKRFSLLYGQTPSADASAAVEYT